MKAPLKAIVAALAVSSPLVAFAQTPAAEPAPAAAAPAAEPAKPAEPLVTIYGTLNVNLQYTKAGDATADGADVSPRFGVSTDSSNIGFRGMYTVSQGLKVTYQCETSANLDGVGAAGLCGRNSRLGLTGDWGTFFYGNWDTPFKAATYGTKAADPFGNTDVYGFQGIMGSPGFNIRSGTWSGASAGATAPQAGFDLRGNNSVAYWSPKIAGGFTFKVQYATDENRNAAGAIQPMLLGATANWDSGPLSVNLAGEYHEDAYGLATVFGNEGKSASKDWAWRLAAGYALPVGENTLTLVGMVEQLKYGQKDAPVDEELESYGRIAFLAGAKFRAGPHEVRVRYMQALDPSCTIAGGTDCADDPVSDEITKELGATSYSLGYAYSLGKSAELYAYFMQIKNDELAQYTLTIGGSAEVAGKTPVGADPMAVGLGLKYGF